MTHSLHWSLSFPRIVSLDAEIFKSARAGSVENVKHLFSLGEACAKDTTVFGTTLLHSASRSGNSELVRLLIQEGADVNAQDEDGESPLHGAMARSDNYDVARILIENGADLTSKAADAKTPLHSIYNNTIGRVFMRDDMFELMKPDSEAMTITHFLAWSSRSTAEIFQRGHSYDDDADLFSADCLGRSCLHLAAARGNLEVLSYLVGQASPETLDRKDIRGRTPLHYAADSSRALGIIDILIGKGCEVNVTDNTGQTALDWARRRKNLNAVEKLTASFGEGQFLSSTTDTRLPSQEIYERKAPAMRDLGYYSGFYTEQSNNTGLRPVWATQDAYSGIYFILKLVGVLALGFMVFLGFPD